MHRDASPCISVKASQPKDQINLHDNPWTDPWTPTPSHEGDALVTHEKRKMIQLTQKVK